MQPPQAGLANGVISSYRVRCIPTGDFPSAAGVNVMIPNASAEVGGFTSAADYMCFFTAFTSEGMGPETTTGLDVTTCKLFMRSCLEFQCFHNAFWPYRAGPV